MQRAGAGMHLAKAGGQIAKRSSVRNPTPQTNQRVRDSIWDVIFVLRDLKTRKITEVRL
jgi:hypothetical protein